MPAYYEMLVSQSPPLYSCSPPTGFLSEYGPNRFYESPRFCRSAAVLSPLSARRFPPSNQIQPSLYQTHLQNMTKSSLSPKPRRSCLVRKESTIQTSCENSEVIDCEKMKAKKRVVFADDRGLKLEHVKIMQEASTQPPQWTLQFLANLTQGLISPVPKEMWSIDFRQPASDYLEFRHMLETNNVSLENVIVKEAESVVVGTVKVKNLDFHKEVFIRSTYDNWKSETDTYCTYSKIYGAAGAYVIYDTFAFRLTLPPHTRTLEFCVCYRTDGKEFWDNFGGANYKLTNNVARPPPTIPLVIPSPPSPPHFSTEDEGKDKKQEQQLITETHESSIDTDPDEDIVKPRFGSWSEFSTRHSDMPLPYW